MKRTAPLAVTACLAAVLSLTGCQSHTQSCRNGTCHVTVNGAGQTIEVNDYDLRIISIGADSVRMQAEGGATATLKVGARERLGPITIKVTSVGDDSVKFDVN
ncbi:hypothetical protein SAMN04489712_102229 [Thermomonospora echinospora]|uniref:Uncharacterized protein n=1 Tax=Thermomonospora echinospora TaxID=1992 RepID=A0A1H5VA09_9ACTN|nr:hypothetical protein [Thermomonospora echinospora]SEF84050.1 hypothetical protein SAMN04489712_102229 [Thermomonospora echinospora]